MAGGETVPLASGLVNSIVLDAAPDSSALLISYGTHDDTYIGILPLPGGQLRRVTRGESTAFFPDGKQIAYCDGRSMYVAQATGQTRASYQIWDATPIIEARRPSLPTELKFGF